LCLLAWTHACVITLVTTCTNTCSRARRR
jgi:hypothetical protein